MRLLLAVLVTVLAVAHSSHRRYRSPDAIYHPHAESLRHTPISYSPCTNGLAPRSDGKCVFPKVSKDVYFFNAPKFEAPHSPPLYEPQPKVHYNYVFVKTADKERAHHPLIIPPAKQKTVVYLLSEKPGRGKQEVIEVPFHPTQPEVHFVGYQDGDNPSLPGGIDLQTALAHADRTGLGSSFAEHGNVGLGGSFIESGNGLDSFGSIHHGSGDLHGLSGHDEISGHHGLSGHHELSDQFGFSGQHELSGHHGLIDHHGVSGHGLAHHHGVISDYEDVGDGGITALSGVHFKDGSPFSGGFGDDFGGRFDDRFHRDVRERHTLGRDRGSTRSSGTSSSAISSGTSLSGPSRESRLSGISRGSSSSGISRGTPSGGTSRVSSSIGTSRGVSPRSSRGSSSSVTSKTGQPTRFVPSPRVEYH